MLKSWAVTRGPSLVVGEKRLAVHTEDHPIDYLTFEGNIPRGEYGAGAMIVWDQGPLGASRRPAQGLCRKVTWNLCSAGHRLKGRWHLVRIRPKPGEKTDPWLLIKAEDEFARSAADPAITDEETTSFLSGRTTQELADRRASCAPIMPAGAKSPPRASRWGRLSSAVRGARKGLLPAFLEPSQAQSAERPPSGEKWVHEIKYDGYRIQARVDGSTIKLLTRKGLDWTERFPRLVAALRRLELASAWIDGEIVVEDAGGIPSFNLLQADLSEGREDRLRYFVFDLLYCEGFDLTKATLARSQGLAGEDHLAARARFAAALERTPRPGRADDVRACLPPRPRGHCLQARRSALPAGPRRPLDQDEEHLAPGIRDRRLHPIHGRDQVDRLAAARLLQGWQASVRGRRRHWIFGAASEIAAGRAGKTPCRQAAIRPRVAGGLGQDHPLGCAQARVRGRIQRLLSRRAGASGLIQGIARGPSPGRGGARTSDPLPRDRHRDPSKISCAAGPVSASRIRSGFSGRTTA